ncbi:hypothetical protein [Cryptosporangium minutisporangium]|uniref:hypothetical protein n=1 Tax=Cryptosporangium minutisporangium TaxID=113569 RepID=UPI0035E9D125
MGKLDGKTAFITGAVRGQGRSHAVRLAGEGADIIAVDLCAQIRTVPYAMSTPDDLRETVAQVEALDRRIAAREADVRDLAALTAVLAEGQAPLGLKGTGSRGDAGGVADAAAKHGVVGLMRTFTNWLSPLGIRVNSVPGTSPASRSRSTRLHREVTSTATAGGLPSMGPAGRRLYRGVTAPRAPARRASRPLPARCRAASRSAGCRGSGAR